MQQTPAYKLLSQLNDALGPEHVLKVINEKVAPVSNKYTRNSLWYWINSKQKRRNIPEQVKAVVVDAAFRHLTPWGDFIVEDPPTLVRSVIDLLRRSDRDQKEALDVAHRLYNSCNQEEATSKVRLAAIIGIIYRMEDDLNESENWFTTAVEQSIRHSPDLFSRYRTSLLNIQRDKVDVEKRVGNLNFAEYKEKLMQFYREQQAVLVKSNRPKDQALAMKHLLRLCSLLCDERHFDEVLTAARQNKGFGETPEDRDASLLDLFSIENDKDGDFVNVRGRFRGYLDLKNSVSHKNKKRKKLASRVMAILLPVIIAIPVLSSVPNELAKPLHLAGGNLAGRSSG